MIVIIFTKKFDNQLNKVVVGDIRTLFSLVSCLDTSSEITFWNIPDAVVKGGMSKVYGWPVDSMWVKFNALLQEDNYNSFKINKS
jgi:hypothetical protein